MTDQEKIILIDYLMGKLSAEDINKISEGLLNRQDSIELMASYATMIKQIDIIYARKKIRSRVENIHFIEEAEVPEKIPLIGKKEVMNSKVNWIHYSIMVFISIITSLLVFTFLIKEETSSDNETPKTKQVEQEKPKLEDNKILMDEDKKGVDIMGIALNRTGFYLLPYSVNTHSGVFGSNQRMTNNLPLSIVWDDKEMGLAVATFADKNLEKLPALPYRFSKEDYFLGEELFFVFSSKSGIKINSGIVIEDEPMSATMKVHLELKESVYGAVVMNKSGVIVGISEEQNPDGNVSVVKTKELYQMVSEMNLDKGVDYISMPSQNYFKTKTNAERIESLKPFIAWFNSK